MKIAEYVLKIIAILVVGFCLLSSMIWMTSQDQKNRQTLWDSAYREGVEAGKKNVSPLLNPYDRSNWEWQSAWKRGYIAGSR